MFGLNFIQFAPFKGIDIGPGPAQLEFLGERLNHMKFKSLEQNLVKNLVDIFVGGTHSLQVYLVIVYHPCFCYFFVAFRNNIVRILLESFVQLL